MTTARLPTSRQMTIDRRWSGVLGIKFLKRVLMRPGLIVNDISLMALVEAGRGRLNASMHDEEPSFLKDGSHLAGAVARHDLA